MLRLPHCGGCRSTADGLSGARVFVDNFVTAIHYQSFANSLFLNNFNNWRNQVRDQEVGGSNPLAPTNQITCRQWRQKQPTQLPTHLELLRIEGTYTAAMEFRRPADQLASDRDRGVIPALHVGADFHRVER
jgi:hypothetical protein